MHINNILMHRTSCCIHLCTVDREIFVVNTQNLFTTDNFYGEPSSSTEFTCAALTVLQVLRFFKAADGLPDLKRSLSLSVPSRGIASENREQEGARFDKRQAEAEGKKRGPYRRYSTAQKNALSAHQ